MNRNRDAAQRRHRTEKAFDDAAIDALAEEGYVVIDGWLGRLEASALRQDLLARLGAGSFSTARIGAGAGRQEAVSVRGDSVCWFDVDARRDAADGRFGVLPGREVTRFLARMTSVLEHLSRTCRLSLSRLECHATCFEPGAYYEAHRDTPDGDSRRVISFSHYLSDRVARDVGGCLRMHDESRGPIDIEPLFDRLVVFQSRRMLHEVLPVAVRRLSMTGWMSGAGGFARKSGVHGISTAALPPPQCR